MYDFLRLEWWRENKTKGAKWARTRLEAPHQHRSADLLNISLKDYADSAIAERVEGVCKDPNGESYTGAYEGQIGEFNS